MKEQRLSKETLINLIQESIFDEMGDELDELPSVGDDSPPKTPPKKTKKKDKDSAIDKSTDRDLFDRMKDALGIGKDKKKAPPKKEKGVPEGPVPGAGGMIKKDPLDDLFSLEEIKKIITAEIKKIIKDPSKAPKTPRELNKFADRIIKKIDDKIKLSPENRRKIGQFINRKLQEFFVTGDITIDTKESEKARKIASTMLKIYKVVESEVNAKGVPEDMASAANLIASIYFKVEPIIEKSGLSKKDFDNVLAYIRKQVLRIMKGEDLEKPDPADIAVATDTSSDSKKKKKKGSSKKKSRRSLPFFLRRYKSYEEKFKKKYGALDKDAFRKFYSKIAETGVKGFRRDFQFGRQHAKQFERLHGDEAVSPEGEILVSTYNKIITPAKERYRRAGSAAERFAILRRAINKLEKAYGGKLTAFREQNAINDIIGR